MVEDNFNSSGPGDGEKEKAKEQSNPQGGITQEELDNLNKTGSITGNSKDSTSDMIGSASSYASRKNVEDARSKYDERMARFKKQVEQQNNTIELENLSEREKKYATELDGDSYEKIKQIESQIEALKESEQSYETVDLSKGPMVNGLYGDLAPIEDKVMKTETRSQINNLREQYNSLTDALDRQYSQELQNKIDRVTQSRESKDFMSWDAFDLDNTLHLLGKAKDRVDAKVEGRGLWGGLLNGFTDPDIALGIPMAISNIRALTIAKKLENGGELSESEKLFMDAFSTLQDSYKVKPKGSYEVGNATPESFAFMGSLYLTGGAGSAVEKTVQKASGKLLGKYAKSKAANWSIKALSKSAGMATQTAMLPSTYGDIAQRHVGEVQVERDADGKIKNFYVRDSLHEKITKEYQKRISEIASDPNSKDEQGNLKPEASSKIEEYKDMIASSKPQSLLESGYKGFMNNFLELTTEKIGGEKVARLLSRLGIRTPSILKTKGRAKARFDRVKNVTGWNGFLPEVIEEEMMIPMNAALVGDSSVSDLFDIEQQTMLLSQVGLTTGMMSAGGNLMTVPDRIKNRKWYKQWYEDRAKAMDNFQRMSEAEEKELQEIINFSNSGSIMQKVEQLKKNGKTQEASDLKSKLFESHLQKAVETNTLDDFEDALDNILKKPNVDEVTKNAVIKAKSTLGMVRDTATKFRGYRDLGLIIKDKYLQETNKDTISRIEQEKFKLSQDIEDDIKAWAEDNNQPIPEFSGAELFSRAEEIEDKKEREEYEDFLKMVTEADLASVRELINLQVNQTIAEEANKSLRKDFNKRTSSEYQEGMATLENINKRVVRSNTIKKAIAENDVEAFDEEFDRIKNKYGGRFKNSPEVKKMKEKFQSQFGKSKESEEIQKQQKAGFEEKPEEKEQREASQGNPVEKAPIVKAATEIETEQEKKNTKDFKNTATKMKAKFTLSDEGFAQKPKTRTIPKPKSTSGKENGGVKGQIISELRKKGVEGDQAELVWSVMTDAEKLARSNNEDIDWKAVQDRANEQGFVPEDYEETESVDGFVVAGHGNLLDDFNDAPRKVEGLSDTNRQALKEGVAEMREILSRDKANPTFEDLVNKYMQLTSEEQAEEYFEALTLGWTINEFPKTDFNKVYEKMFKPYESALGKINQIFEDTQPKTREEVEETNDKSTRETEKKKAPITRFTEENRPVRTTSPKTVTPDLKLGFLALNYKEEVNEDGEVIRTTTSDEVNRDGFIDPTSLLDPNKYSPGTKLRVEIPNESQLENVSIYSREKGKKVSRPFGLWLSENLQKNPEFRETQEYIDKVPMVVYNKQGERVAFIHETSWYNNDNVGFEDDPVQRAEVIKEGRKQARELRNAIFNGESTIEITSKFGTSYEKVPVSQPARTLAENNPDTIVAIGKNRGQIDDGSGNFNTDSREVLNPDNITPGAAYELRHMGKNEQGKDTYMAFRVLTGEKVDNRYLLTEDAYNNLKWTFAAFAKLNNYDSWTPGFEISQEKAQEIADAVLDMTDLDISIHKDFREYSRMFSQPKNLKDFSGLYKSNPMVAKNFGVNVSAESLRENTKIPTIDSDGNIVGESNYKDFLKNTLRTTVKSFNIGTKDNPIYATNMQPNVKYKLSSGETITIDKKIEQETKQAIQETKPTTETIEKDPAGQVVESDNYSDKENFEDNMEEWENLQGELDKTPKEAGMAIKEFLINRLGWSPSDFKMSILPTGEFRFTFGNQSPVTIDSEMLITGEGKTLVRINYEDLLEKKSSTEQKQEETAPISDLETYARKYLTKLGLGSDIDYDSLDLPTQIEDTSIIKQAFKTLQGLNPLQEYQLIDFVFNRVSAKVGIGKGSRVTKEEVLKQTKDSYKEIVEPIEQELSKLLAQLENLYKSDTEKYSNLADLIGEYSFAIDTLNNIKSNWPTVEEKTIEKLYKYTGIKETPGSQEEIEDPSLREKDYNKSSLEESSKDKTSYRLRRFFASIEERTPNKEKKKGFLGLPTYVSFSKVFNDIAKILSSPVETESDFETMIAKLKQSKDSYPWLPDVIEKLENADDQIKNEFVYNYTNHNLSMKFAMYSVDDQGNYSLKVYDTNANEITRNVRDTWKSNFITSPLVNASGEFYSINKDVASKLLEEFEGWKNPSKVSDDTLRGFLNYFGIALSQEAFTELKEKGMYYNGELIPFNKMFEGNDTLFGLLHKYLKYINKKENTEFEENENNHPFTDMGGVLKTLSIIESKYTTDSITLSFRDNGKSIFALTPNKFVTDRILDLRQFDEEGNNEMINKLRKLSISSESYVLDLLETDPDFRKKFEVNHMGLTSLKQLGKKSNSFSGITDLNTVDHDLVKLTFFQDIKQGQVKASVNKKGKVVAGSRGITMRMGRMFLPTMSDKSQMLTLATGVFDFFKQEKKSFTYTPDGNVQLTDRTKQLLFNQLVLPELKRIINFHNNINNTDVKGYDLAAQIFNFIPALNNIKDEDGIRMIEDIAMDENVSIDKVKDKYGEKIFNVLEGLVGSNVNKKKEIWEDNIERDSEGNINNIKFFDKAYLDQISGSLDKKYELALYDFVLNSMISNANMFNIVAGDPAVYAQDKLFKKFDVSNLSIKTLASQYGKENAFKSYGTFTEFRKDLDRLHDNGTISTKLYQAMKEKVGPLPYSASDQQFIDLAKAQGTNIGKRLALLIAPGKKLANSKDDKYMQIFLDDAVHISENSDYLINLFYGQEALDKSQPLLTQYHNSNNVSEKRGLATELSKRFPKIKDYFSIESTDAQEYTTVKEHVGVLRRQGRITDDEAKEINDKIKKGQDLTKEDLDLVLQPIKPVHTGQVLDEVQDVMRTVYVKSSSFPLIPQLTKGRKLDALRMKMEEIEERNQMPVRASYQTANKVGAMKNPINPFDEASLAKAEEASLVLDRSNFRIQQDVPFKSDIKKEDKVSMGTQIFKLLFGDGMMDQEDFFIDGKRMTGRELYNKFNEDFGQLLEFKKQGLYLELGLDENGVPKDPKDHIEKLQDLLKREAVERGFPRQDIEGLTILEKQDTKGNTYYEFKLPLWLSANSNRYESLLNSIIANRLISQKMPGNSYVVGSEEGLDVTESMEGIDQSRVILVGDYNGGELKGVNRRGNSFQKAQVLVPSKFKDKSGKLIDLYQKKNGKHVYLEKGNNNELRLKEGMIDKELFDNFSFRTPTSSHVSGSLIEIVGILPPESGDLMVVPKNFTTQKGLDYDVDKETAYQLWHRVTSSGEIKVLDREYVDNISSNLDKNFEKLQKDYSKAGNVGRSLAVLDEFLMGVLPEEEIEAIVETENQDFEEKITRIKNKLEQKLLENEFVRVHMSVYANPKDQIQEKINKVLSMDFASEQADMIEELNNTNNDDTMFSILSDEYQKEKMGLGAAGKLAIGVYSNYVTFHGLSQQLDVNNRLSLSENGTPKKQSIRIGNFESKGLIGNQMTLDGERTIAEVFAEKQNTATDNEKEQILGRVNVNSHTINVDALLSLLGFDKGEKVDGKETSIPYLLLSQPIIKEYVKMKQASQAITAEYNFGQEEEIIADLFARFAPNLELDPVTKRLKSEDEAKYSKDLTSESMIEGIRNNGQIGTTQVAALNTFLKLNEYAQGLSEIQNVINTTDLGKSIVEAQDKYDKLRRLSSVSNINNSEKLVGDFMSAEQYVEMQPEGFLRIGDVFVKPTTPQGKLITNGIKTGAEMWEEFFPYSSTGFTQVMKEVFEVTSAEDKSSTKQLELKFEVIKEAKRYLNSMRNTGIFDERASKERERLFIDKKGNQSLASYLNDLKINEIKKYNKEKKPGVYHLKNNRLFNKFSFTLNTNGDPSLIKFNNSQEENFDEDYLYTAIPELIINNRVLPDYNGQSYSTKQLASDLMAYSFLEGGVQEAIQFSKYIPLELLESVGYTEVVQNFNNNANSNGFSNLLGVNKEVGVSRFVKQFMQHNPQYGKQFSSEDEAKIFNTPIYKDKKLTAFILDDSKAVELDGYPEFITKKNKTKSKRNQEKFTLFEHKGNGEYRSISILGTHGMNEYEHNNPNATSIIEEIKPEPSTKKPNNYNPSGYRGASDVFKIQEGNIRKSLTKIANSSLDDNHLPELAKVLSNFLEEGNIVLAVEDTSKGGTKNKARGRATKLPNNRYKIVIDNSVINSNDHNEIAKVLLHETLHSVTRREVERYIDSEGRVSQNAPTHVSRLMRVYTEARRQIGEDRIQEAIKKYKAGVGLTSEDINAYGVSNLFEFISVAMTEKDFQKELKDKPYMKSGKSIWEKFKEAVSKLVSNLSGAKEGTLGYESVSSILDFIAEERGPKSNKNTTFVDKRRQESYNTDRAKKATDMLNQSDLPQLTNQTLRNLPDICE